MHLFALALPGARQRQHAGERDADPDHTGRDIAAGVFAGEERERRDDRHQHGEEARGGDDLAGRQLDRQIFLGDQPHLPQPRGPLSREARCGYGAHAFLAA
jgi:hypothetical protein